MSAIFMCDNCGNVFSVNEVGWTEYTQRTNESNNYNHGAKTMHMGPCCAAGNVGGIRPRVAMMELDSGEIK